MSVKGKFRRITNADEVERGGFGSGNFGHKGLPGKRGGSNRKDNLNRFITDKNVPLGDNIAQSNDYYRFAYNARNEIMGALESAKPSPEKSKQWRSVLALTEEVLAQLSSDPARVETLKAAIFPRLIRTLNEMLNVGVINIRNGTLTENFQSTLARWAFLRDQGESLFKHNLTPSRAEIKGAMMALTLGAIGESPTQFIVTNSTKRIIINKGGGGSGHFDHAGRPGEVGGSAPGGSSPGKGAGDSGGLANNFSYRDSKASEHFDRAISDLDEVFIGRDEWGNIKVSGYNGRGEGRYDPDAEKIQINNKSLNPEFTFIHEIGHAMDYGALRDTLEMEGVTATISSFVSTKMDTFWDAIDNSDAIKSLKDMKADDPSSMEYLLDVREIHARAFSQYVAETSGSSVLLQQLDNVREHAWYSEQWTTADFAPIKSALDDLYGGAGLLR